MNETTRTIQFVPARRGGDVSLQMAPMIDIVFLLICFYLLVSQLISTQSDPAVQLPAMNSPLAARQQPAEMVVNLRDDGAAVVGGVVRTGEQLRGLLAANLAEARTPLRVVIRADRRQRYANLDEVLEICRELKIRNVILRAQGGSR